MIKTRLFLAIAVLALTSFTNRPSSSKKRSLNGSWRLVSSKSITKKDTVDTSPAKGIETIKLYNDTHFTFFTHNTDKSVTPTYDSGAGMYTLYGNKYTEHLKYCSEREWENHVFNFTIQLKQNSFVQRGVEKIDSLHIDHIIIETYVRIK
ncbi:MAG TPA: hypothetical protein VFE54_10985 [Mucilaginibacter sp.]|jgi:hypothetical protein|nr:hypothetical protein [Mucilaginibacter sp.]